MAKRLAWGSKAATLLREAPVFFPDNSLCAWPANRLCAKPNILFIMVDDLGKDWISCYGADDIETPHIDRLAKGGLKFHNAWSMPQCTPTRATLLTGQYPWRTGWVNHWDVPLGRRYTSTGQVHLVCEGDENRRLRHRHRRQVADQRLSYRAQRVEKTRLRRLGRMDRLRDRQPAEQRALLGRLHLTPVPAANRTRASSGRTSTATSSSTS